MEDIMKAIHLMENNDHDKAIAQLEASLEKADDEQTFTIAEIYVQWGYVKEAIAVLESLKQAYPNESELNVMLAELYIEEDDDERAIELLNVIDEKDEFYIQALVQLADLYQSQGLFEVAEQKLLTAKQIEPNEVVIDLALGELYFSIGEYLKAITYYEHVLSETTSLADVSIPLRLAEAHAASGAYEQALTYYQQANPEHPDALFKYGLSAHQVDRNDIAIKVWEHVLEIDKYYYTAYYYLAEAYDAEEMTNDALLTAEKGLAVDEYNAHLYLLAGQMAHKLNQDQESEKYVRQAVALDPDFKEAVLFLIELLKANDQHDAIIELLQSIKRTETVDALYDWELARAYNEIDRYKDALKHYEAAYNTLNKDSDFLKEYAFFLMEEGMVDTAIRIFDAYMTLQPLDSETEAYVDRLKEAQN
ncbi:tetratricopeptide repeat protein [Lentibacillus saliphilus]|uniref:tetratricopeptide repeat protein n=1 Tax=Lentibacillus saliphilus TaxID=2737028 RepID=UPI001C300D8C|nr:tetratricopeptide repeat protein [Lentibacillus saliphilus]